MTDPHAPSATQGSEASAATLDAHSLRGRLDEHPLTPIVVPVGAFEQHGPHLPLGTDGILATAIGTAVAAEIGGTALPALSYGYKSQPRSGGGNTQFGTLSLDATTLIHIVCDLTRALLEDGFRRIVLINGHFENYQHLYEGVDLALREHRDPEAEPPEVVLLSYWDFVSDDVLTRIYGDEFPGWDVEHGGTLETSLLLHLHPELVHLDRAPTHPAVQNPPFDVLPESRASLPRSGVLSSPDTASAENGSLLHEAVVDSIATTLRTRWADGR